MARINSNPLGGLTQPEVDARVAAGITGKADASALSSLASAADLSTLSGTVSSLSSAVDGKADSSALTDLQNNIGGALAATAGLQADFGPNAITGDGTEKTHNIVVHPSFTPADGHKYEINGVIRANVHGGSQNKIVHVRIEGLVASYSTGGGFVADDVGSVAIEDGTDGGGFLRANFYTHAGGAYVASEVPAIGLDGANIQIVHTLVNAAQIDLEFDGTVVDHGTSGTA